MRGAFGGAFVGRIYAGSKGCEIALMNTVGTRCANHSSYDYLEMVLTVYNGNESVMNINIWERRRDVGSELPVKRPQ